MINLNLKELTIGGAIATDPYTVVRCIEYQIKNIYGKNVLFFVFYFTL